MYDDSLKVLLQIDSADFADRIIQLQLAIQYEMEEISNARSFIS